MPQIWLYSEDKTNQTMSLKRSYSDHNTATSMARHVMLWLYYSFLIPLLKASFYVTEAEIDGVSILFYRKPVWSKIRATALKNLREKHSMKTSVNTLTVKHMDSPQCADLYFASTDIHKCYDSIKQEHLFDLLKGHSKT
mmetsp:Transcript_11592/g.16405  ORF Transcript_11592/g.16405 Transcript_11592/m.16405 type:complete len:139 (+) Transcript_11592:197-613(+)